MSSNKSDLINLIKSNYYKFSKGQKQIAQFIIEHYDKAAFMTAAKIGETVDVSESTVVRFASFLGYSGFPELQKALQVLIKNKLTTVQRIGLDEDINNSDKLHKKILRNEINNMRYLLENLDTNALDKATDLILNAKKVYILGLRTSSTLANYLGFYLDVILDNVKVLNNIGVNSLYEEIIRIKETDVLIVLSFPRYSNNTIEATKFVKEHNAKIIAITDTEASPFHSMADVSLLAKSNMVSFVDSLVAPMCIINSLIINIGLQEKEDILQYYDRLEELWDSHSIYQHDN
jgi:DNA-binding MurR/RpiR family transcriptional regulator